MTCEALNDLRIVMYKQKFYVINLKSKRRNGVLHVKDDGLMVDWLKRHHIILRKVMMSYLVVIER